MRIGVLGVAWVALGGACGRRGLGASSSVDGGNLVDAGAPSGDGPGALGDAGSVPLSGSCQPGRAPLRRLTRFEYNNTVRDLLGDTTRPADGFPPEVVGSRSGFPNDVDYQGGGRPLIDSYRRAAKAIAARATSNPVTLARFAPCLPAVSAANADACARTFVESFTAAAYRRPLAPGEADELLSLHTAIRSAPGGDFAKATAGVVEAVLQSPDFLYRIEWGVDDAGGAGRRRPTGDEMATRLSYLFWGTAADDELRAAARTGALETADGVKAQAIRLLADARSRGVVRFFFDNLLPISYLGVLQRDPTRFPSFSPAIGELMREETQLFLENEIFAVNGSWPSVLTAPYTFVNEPLARFYGMAAVTGDGFRMVPVQSRRLGLLTQGGVMAGTVLTNLTSPILRGAFVVRKLLCRDVPSLSDPAIVGMVGPDVPTGNTARERITKLTSPAVCGSCHQQLDPPGFALENFNAVGLYRETENGEIIDASVTVPGLPGVINGGVELARALADSSEAQACFAKHWLEFAYGRALAADGSDACLQDAMNAAFRSAGYNVRQLLLDLTQTDAFLFLSKE